MAETASDLGGDGTETVRSGRVAEGIRRQLAGEAVDADLVVWRDAKCEVLVDLGSIDVHCVDGVLEVRVALECADFGRHALTVGLGLSGREQPPSLVAVTDALPAGHPGLAARWGPALQDGVWAAVVELAAEQTAPRELAGIRARSGALEAHPS